MVRTVGEICAPIKLVAGQTKMTNVVKAFVAAPARRAFVAVARGAPSGLILREQALDWAFRATKAQKVTQTLDDCAASPFRQVDASLTLDQLRHEVFNGLIGETTSLLVSQEGQIVGFISAFDLLAILYREAQNKTSAPAAIPEKTNTVSDTRPDLLGVLAHEIRTPLTAIMGLSEMLSRRKLAPEDKTVTETIMRSSEALDRIVTDTLDYARLGAGKLKSVSAATSLAELATDLTALWATRASAKDLSLHVEFTGSHTSLVKVDAGRVRQVLNNLISNAIKFTPHGGVSVQLDALPVGSQYMLRADVADTGQGIPHSERQRIFSAFETGVQTQSEVPSWGLGLSISKALTEHLGGSLTVSDNPEGGSKFTLLVPVDRVRPELVSETKPKSGKFELGRALLIEDHDASAFVLSEALETAGWTVDRAVSVFEGRLALSRQAYQIVLTDLHLADGDASALGHGAKLAAHRNLDTPILAVTADTSLTDDEIIRRFGVERVLRKPVPAPALVACVADVLMARAMPSDIRPQLRGKQAG